MDTGMDHQEPSDDPPPGYPRWALLERDNHWEDPDTVTEALSSGGGHDADTVTEALASDGRHVRVSFHFASPPAVTRLRVDSPGVPDGSRLIAQIIAAHGDSVLLNIITSGPGLQRDSSDYFVYNAGDAAADPSRPPSLSLLPPCHEGEDGEPKRERIMSEETIALLRRGEHDLLVAELRLPFCGTDGELVEMEAELCLIRSGEWEWELKRLPVHCDDAKRHEVSLWETDAVIPVGDRFFCWADYHRGVIFSDVWEETPQLRYVSLPVEPNLERRSRYNYGSSSYCRVCATDGGRAVSFVEVFPRCCCGCRGATFCERSRHAFNITTWTLRMDDMTTWDKAGVIDSDELWSLPGYRGLLRIRPEYPVVSLDDPDVLCFMVHKTCNEEDVEGDHAIRLIEVDTKRMELRSIFCYGEHHSSSREFIPCIIPQYFDASRSRPPPAKRQAPTTATTTELNYLSDNNAAIASRGEMLATLREIRDLERDDMMRMYNALACDGSQVMFRLLLALPKNMRKDYCLLIIKNCL